MITECRNIIKDQVCYGDIVLTPLSKEAGGYTGDCQKCGAQYHLRERFKDGNGE